jgi:hypothetical protein
MKLLRRIFRYSVVRVRSDKRMKLCSTMIPSYKRPVLLMNAVESFRKTAADPSCHEVIVRLSDKDDKAEKTRDALLSLFDNCTVLIGPHLRGYLDVGTHYTEMLKHCTGEFINIWDDDMTIEGGHWDVELRKANKKAIILCSRYQLGPSLYDHGSCDGPGIGWFVHRKTWEETGERDITFPPDVYMTEVARKHNWGKEHLAGMILNHNWQRPVDEHR